MIDKEQFSDLHNPLYEWKEYEEANKKKNTCPHCGHCHTCRKGTLRFPKSPCVPYPSDVSQHPALDKLLRKWNSMLKPKVMILLTCEDGHQVEVFPEKVVHVEYSERTESDEAFFMWECPRCERPKVNRVDLD